MFLEWSPPWKQGAHDPTQAAVSQYLATHTAIPEWRPREGRSDNFTLWQDAFGDALADLGLTLASISDMPPPRPLGALANQDTYELWVNAIDQYQLEGTVLFDMVRPSLDVSGAHQEQDLRRISAWKRNGVKDGRALVRWALSFVDRSSVEAQMALQTEINSMRLLTSDTLLGLEKHLYKLFNLWLALGNSDRGAYNSFFCLLLLTMPATPECPIVHVRRYLLELINKSSPLLTNIDGDEGLFVEVIAYGKALGLSDRLAALVAQQVTQRAWQQARKRPLREGEERTLRARDVVSAVRKPGQLDFLFHACALRRWDNPDEAAEAVAGEAEAPLLWGPDPDWGALLATQPSETKPQPVLLQAPQWQLQPQPQLQQQQPLPPQPQPQPLPPQPLPPQARPPPEEEEEAAASAKRPRTDEADPGPSDAEISGVEAASHQQDHAGTEAASAVVQPGQPSPATPPDQAMPASVGMA